MGAHDLVDRYAQRIVDTPAARSALQTIVAAADNPAVAGLIAAGTLPPELDAAYQALFAEAGLGAGGVTAPPGADQEGFAPLETAREWMSAVDVSGAAHGGGGGPGVLGVFDRISDAVLGPVRQMTFWAMKNRARTVGERDVHHILRMLQDASDARIHLMGHSFGCIVMTAATAGPVSGGQLTDPLPRRVDTLFLVQGAMSLWSVADAIPFPPNEPGTPGAVPGAAACRRPDSDHAFASRPCCGDPSTRWAHGSAATASSATTIFRSTAESEASGPGHRARRKDGNTRRRCDLPIRTRHHVQH
jgi:hypothetical protein